MLLKFNFKNFKSFKNEASLDLTATKISEFSESNFDVGNNKVLPVAGILGANASGKSNIMEAFTFMYEYVMMSLNFAGGQVNPVIRGGMIRPIPFLFDTKSKQEGSKFEIYFSMNQDETGKIYQYGFIFNNNIIEEEWLNYKAKTSRENFKTIFYRGKDELDLSGLEKDKIKNIEVSMQKETLILTLGTALKEKLLSEIFKWFRNNITIDFGNPAQNLLISRNIGISQDYFDEKTKREVVKYLSAFDDAIIGMDAKEREVNNITKQKVLEITFKHQMSDGNIGFDLPLQFESAGTQKMFNLYPILRDAFKCGSVIFVDELNSKLHPLLLRTIIQMFMNKDINKNRAQLVFTSHDVWQLKSDIMRRDEIWFTEKDEKGVSSLYSLSDFVDEDGVKIRKDEDYQKNYLLGKYGAIPKLKGFDGVFE